MDRQQLTEELGQVERMRRTYPPGSPEGRALLVEANTIRNQLGLPPAELAGGRQAATGRGMREVNEGYFEAAAEVDPGFLDARQGVPLSGYLGTRDQVPEEYGPRVVVPPRVEKHPPPRTEGAPNGTGQAPPPPGPAPRGAPRPKAPRGKMKMPRLPRLQFTDAQQMVRFAGSALQLGAHGLKAYRKWRQGR